MEIVWYSKPHAKFLRKNVDAVKFSIQVKATLHNNLQVDMKFISYTDTEW